jgi:hypothetical protein
VLSQHSTALLFIDLLVKTLPWILRQETSVTLVVFFLGGAVSEEVHLHIKLFGGFICNPNLLVVELHIYTRYMGSCLH